MEQEEMGNQPKTDKESPTTMIGRSRYGSALGNGPDPVPYKGRDALGRTEPWRGPRTPGAEPPEGDGEVMLPGELELGKPDLLEDSDGAPFPEEVQEAFRTRTIAEADGGNHTDEQIWEADRRATAAMHVPSRPSALRLAEDLLQQAMECNHQGMTNVIEVMGPGERDHILASLHRAQHVLKKKIMEDW